MGERVVVTGGAGFIGSHLADALVARGDDVHVVDNLATGRRDQVPEAATFHELDVADVDAMRELAERIGPVARWYHLAAQADVRVSVEDPAFDAQWFRRTADGVTLITQPMIDKYLQSK